MMTVDILVTDVTDMSAGVVCIAGFSPQRNQMIRPLPDGKHWPADYIDRNAVVPGSTLRVSPAGLYTGSYPHTTENMQIDSREIQVIQTNFTDWTGQQAPPTAKNIQEGFLENMKCKTVWNGTCQSPWIIPDTHCPSLVGIEIPRSSFSLCEPFAGKLKANVFDGDRIYQISVSSRLLKAAFNSGGLLEANRHLPNRSHYHVRVGLARRVDDSPEPPKCYLMVNGVL